MVELFTGGSMGAGTALLKMPGDPQFSVVGTMDGCCKG